MEPEALFIILGSLCLLVLFIVFSIAFPVIVVYLIFRSRKTYNEAWTRAAEQTGLTLIRGGIGYPRLSGSYRERPASVTGRSGGRNSPPYTVYEVEVPASRIARLILSRRNLFTGIESVLGAQDIEIGDTPFDEAFTVRSTEPEKALAFLSDASDLRYRLLDEIPSALRVEGGKVRVSERDIQLDPDLIQRRLDLLVEVASRLEAFK